jgi:hypothetical protein
MAKVARSIGEFKEDREADEYDKKAVWAETKNCEQAAEKIKGLELKSPEKDFEKDGLGKPE